MSDRDRPKAAQKAGASFITRVDAADRAGSSPRRLAESGGTADCRHSEAGHPGDPGQKRFPALIAEIAAAHPEAERLELWFLDEARIGQTGRTCRRWFEKAPAHAAGATSGTTPSICSAPSAQSATTAWPWFCPR